MNTGKQFGSGEWANEGDQDGATIFAIGPLGAAGLALAAFGRVELGERPAPVARTYRPTEEIPHPYRETR